VRSVVHDGIHQKDIIVFCSSGEEKKKIELEARGIRVERLPATASEKRPDIHAVLRRLGQLEITSVMIEGGATVNGMALASGVVDKVFLYYAPKILGGMESIPFAAGASLFKMDDPLQIKHLHLHRYGQDFAVEGYLRDPYEG
jgi:diaminohydroxyphosphoribosylaminopyrimidine deaminase / 5-amino-6-(5-phosphoribosylamino)uracil reductase